MKTEAWNGVLWLVFVAYWFVAALHRSETRRSEPAGERILYVVTMAIGAILVFPSLRQRPQPLSWISLLHLTALNSRFLPEQGSIGLWIGRFGNLFTGVGVAFAIWARYHIGKYWSGYVRIAAGHKLIRSGPYARIRHPIYTGILVALAGTVLVIGEYRTLLGFAILMAALVFKARKEERYLSREFDEAFEEQRRATGFLIPRLF